MEENATAAALPRDMNALLERLLNEAESGSVPPPSHGASPPAPPPPQPEDGGAVSPLAGLLSNPALLAALPTVMENLSPLMGNLSHGVGSAPTATHPRGIDRHTALLCAIKPYLSPRRQEAAETVIRLCRVWDALEKSGIRLGDLLGGLGTATAPQEGRGEHV